MKSRFLLYRLAAFAAAAALGGCPATPETGPDLDALSPPPGTGDADTNPTARTATLLDLSKILGTGAVPTAVTGSSAEPEYIGEYISGTGRGPDVGPSDDDGTSTDSDWTYTGGYSSGGSGGSGGGSNSSGGGGGGGDSNGTVGSMRGEFVYDGSLSGTRYESLGEHGDLSQPATESIAIGLTQAGQLAAVYVPGFVFFPDAHAGVTNAGDHVEFEGVYSLGGLPTDYTLAVTLQTVTYDENSVSATLNIELFSRGGSLIQEGTGVQTLNASWDGANMTYSSTTNYDMVFRPSEGTPNEWWFEPIQNWTFSGTLTR